MLEETRHATVAVEGEMSARVESDTWRLRCEQVRGGVGQGVRRESQARLHERLSNTSGAIFRVFFGRVPDLPIVSF